MDPYSRDGRRLFAAQATRRPFRRHRPDLLVSTQQQLQMSNLPIGEQCRYGIGCDLVAALGHELIITERRQPSADR